MPSILHADLIDGITVTGGQIERNNLHEGIRISPRWNWDHALFPENTISISGFWEATLSFWHDAIIPGVDLNNTHEIIVTSAGPTIQFNYNNVFPWNLHPYLELGTSPSLSAVNSPSAFELSNNFNMEDKIGMGFHLGTKQDIQLGYRYIHYKNQYVSPTFTNLDMHTINLTWLFS
jgi:hypothetical protein